MAWLSKLKAWLTAFRAVKAAWEAVKAAFKGAPSRPPEPKDAKGWTKTGRDAFDSRLDPKD